MNVVDSCPNCGDTYFKNKEIYDKQVTETLQTAFVSGKNREESMKNMRRFYTRKTTKNIFIIV